MKLVTAIIKPDKVEALRQALTSVDIQGLTIVEAKGYGRQKGHTELYRGAEYEVHRCTFDQLIQLSSPTSKSRAV